MDEERRVPRTVGAHRAAIQGLVELRQVPRQGRAALQIAQRLDHHSRPLAIPQCDTARQPIRQDDDLGRHLLGHSRCVRRVSLRELLLHMAAFQQRPV